MQGTPFGQHRLCVGGGYVRTAYEGIGFPVGRKRKGKRLIVYPEIFQVIGPQVGFQRMAREFRRGNVPVGFVFPRGIRFRVPVGYDGVGQEQRTSQPQQSLTQKRNHESKV